MKENIWCAYIYIYHGERERNNMVMAETKE